VGSCGSYPPYYSLRRGCCINVPSILYNFVVPGNKSTDRKALVGYYFIVETKEIKRALGTVPYLCKLFLIKTGKMKNVTAATYGCMHIRLLNFIAYLGKKDTYELILNYLKCSNYFILLQ